MNEENKEKMLNLLADQALFGLSAEESAELERLKKEFPEFENDYSFELAASAINLTNLKTDEQLPAHLQARILDSAEEFFAPAAESKQKVFNFQPQTKASTGFEPVSNVAETSAKTPWWNWLGWGIAAAACVALAVNLWTTRNQPPTEIVKNPPVVQTPTPAEPSARQKRERLLASGGDLMQTVWTEPDPKNAKQISGDVVWSSAEQQGYLRFRGLPANDPNRETYQLWIFDENQSDKYPIDGGVFDVAENGEVVIPIDPKIQVKKPKMFAVTVEKPGGVVVSDRQKLIALAKV